MRKFIFIICFLSFLFITPLSFAQWENPPVTIEASDGANADEFGFSVDVSGDVAIVGAPFHNDPVQNLGPKSGAAYVWRKNGDEWIFEQELLASDGAANDEFGFAVAISGNFAVGGAYNHAGHGAAYVFRYNGATWVQDQKLMPADLGDGDRFGKYLALTDNTLFISAQKHNALAGAVYAYRYNGFDWNLEQKITPPPSATNYFGTAVALSNDVAVIGNYSNPGGGEGGGAAYVFRYNGATWLEEQMIYPTDGSPNKKFSKSLDVSENVIVAGASGDGGGVGAAYVFRFDGQSWSQEEKLLASDGAGGDQFGTSVSVSGNLIVVGAPVRAIYDPVWLPNYGATYVFRNNTGPTWTEEAILLDPQGWLWYEAGNAVSLSGNTVLIGSHLADGPAVNSGKAIIFEGEPVTFECTGDIDNDTEVGVTDFLALLAAWGVNPGHPADLNGDGVVDVTDFLELLAAWGPCP